jgi:DNA-binding NarL/FixJ family response regulator
MAGLAAVRDSVPVSNSVPKAAGDTDPRITVLIVDDDLEFGGVAADLLGDCGYHVVGQATTASEAITVCDRLDPDAILLDVRLPDGHGVTLAELLRGASDRRKILLTSTDREAVRPEQVKRCGASGFVPKTQLARSDLGAFLKG